jgi:hypothetical protein
MATLSTQFPTLIDLASQPKNSEVKDVIELLAQYNPILQDALMLECNNGTRHKTFVRTGLPTVAWGKLYEGVPATKGTKQLVEDVTGFVRSASEVDQIYVDTFEKAEEKMSVRLDEAASHLEAMAQEFATAVFYHDSQVDPSKPTGFAPRFNDLAAENGKQIIDGGGAGNTNTSIWLITWAEDGSHLIYPKGSTAGVKRKDRGVEVAFDSNNRKYHVYREDFELHFGLSVRNWQYVSRVANIDVEDLEEDANAGANIVNLMTEAYYVHKGRRVKKGRTFWYMNTTCVKFLDYQSRLQQNTNLFLTWEKYGPNAEEVLTFRGIPIHECDAIVETEGAVA